MFTLYTFNPFSLLCKIGKGGLLLHFILLIYTSHMVNLMTTVHEFSGAHNSCFYLPFPGFTACSIQQDTKAVLQKIKMNTKDMNFSNYSSIPPYLSFFNLARYLVTVLTPIHCLTFSFGHKGFFRFSPGYIRSCVMLETF